MFTEKYNYPILYYKMCFDQKTSFLTFSISFLCFVYLVYNGITTKNNYDIFAGIVTLLIGNMQLIEFFLWKSNGCNQENHFFSLMIMVTLYLQPCIGSLSYYYLFQKKYTPWIEPWLYGIIFIYTCITIFILYWLNQRKLCSQKMEKGCRLIWGPFYEFNRNIFGGNLFLVFLFFYFTLLLYAIGLFDSLISMKFFEGYIKYPLRYAFLPVTFIVAGFLISQEKNAIGGDIFGSTWCFMAVGFGFLSCLGI